MAIEIEKKYRLTAELLPIILQNLEQFGAIFQGEEFEENNIYWSESLLAKRAVLRVRKTREKTVLTYKQRIENKSAVKHQIEHETAVADADEMKNIIECLGYEKAIVYEKRRRTWKFRRATIVVDELPFGHYMEIEGSLTEIAEAEMLLDLEALEAEHETYPRLTKKFGTPAGRVIEARFV